MAVTRDIAKNWRAVSLFSGAGGLDIGLKEAGFTIEAAIELDHASCESLRLNKLANRVYEADIRQLSPSLVMNECNLETGELDVISAGPPCQSFSNIGNRKGLEDPRGLLFEDLMRFVAEMRPAFVITENVPGMRTVAGNQVVNAVIESFEGIGYTVSTKILNSADYGVPQVRKRLFFIASRDGIIFDFPKPTHSKDGSSRLKRWVSVGEALSTLPNNYMSRSDNFHMNHSEAMVEKMKLIPPGKNFKVLPKELLPNCWSSGRHQGQDTFGRLELNKPSVTIRTAAYNPTKGRYIHPTHHRGLTTIEMAVLQSFPYNYRFFGGIQDVGRQIGNAVPPLMGKVLGERIIKILSGEVHLNHNIEAWASDQCKSC